MKITDERFLRPMLRSRPLDLPSIFARRLREALSTAPSGIATTWFGDVRYDVDLSLHAISRKYYFKTHEMFLENVFRRFLKPGSTFIDIGSNMGYWSAFSAPLVTKTGDIHAFEPVPRLFESVSRLAMRNPQYRIHANNVALGAEDGTASIAVIEPTAENYDNFEKNIGSNSMMPGFLAEYEELVNSIEVDVTTFDNYAEEKRLDLDKIGLIKIDVEGFEAFCFKGMQRLLAKPGKRVPILCEILTDHERGQDGKALVQMLEGYGYRCHDSMTMKPLDVDHLQHEENVVCI